MSDLVENLREHGTNASVNSLGEVQMLGGEVDRECALLDMAKERYREETTARQSQQPRAAEPPPAELGEAAARQEAASRKYTSSRVKTYPAHDRKGRHIRVTIPED